MSNALVYLRPTRIACVRVVGPYEETVPVAWERLRAWTDAQGLTPTFQRGFGIHRDSPQRVGPDKCRYEACVQLAPQFEDRAMRELMVATLPGGPYSRTRHAGSYVPLRRMLASLHETFEAPPELRLDDRRPIVVIYLDNPHRVEAKELRAEVCVPVSAAPARNRAA